MTELTREILDALRTFNNVSSAEFDCTIEEFEDSMQEIRDMGYTIEDKLVH